MKVICVISFCALLIIASIDEFGLAWGLVVSITAITVLALLACFAFICEASESEVKRSNVMKFRDLPNYRNFIVIGRSSRLFYKAEGFVERKYSGDNYNIWDDTMVLMLGSDSTRLVKR